MANKITEPRVDQANLDDWSYFIARTTRQGGGFMCIGLDNIDTAGVPSIAAGSRFELNGAFYEVEKQVEEIEITLGELTGGKTYYIYAVPKDGNCVFEYASTPPVWSADKGGWYSGNSRAIAKFYYVDKNYNGKVILDSFNAMSMVNINQPFPLNASGNPVGGTECYYFANTPRHNGQGSLEAGAYRYSIQGGSGGKGGAGYNDRSARSGSNGEDGQIRGAVVGTFFWPGGPIRISVGQDGGDGQDGTDDCRNGGGGGAGGSSSIEGVITVAGGLYGDGGANKYTDFDGRERGEAGHPARNSYGGVGGAAGRWLITRKERINDTDVISIEIKEAPSRPAGPLPNVSSGHVQIWRLW